MNDKTTIRARLLEERKKISPEELKVFNEKVKLNLKRLLEAKNYQTVHCFEPISSLGEIDVTGLFDTNELFTTRKIDGEWKIVSVDVTDEVPNQFDLIIVPMLGFDSSLNRIGYGGGYYDEFLASQTNTPKVGVCLEQGKVEKLPVEPHDIPLDAIVTDSAIYQR